MSDPWRVVDPLRPSARSERTDLADRDMEADWRPTRACVLRFRACSFEMASTRLNSPRDALAVLAACVIELKRSIAAGPRAHRLLSCVRVRTGRDSSDDTTPGPPGARLTCEDIVLEFPGTTLANGTLSMARALMAAGHDNKLAPVLRRHGVTPMLRTT